MITFHRLLTDHSLFFDILPDDWQVEIVPRWTEYKESAEIYVLLEKEHVLAGGILFKTVSPDVESYPNKAQYWLDKGYEYIAFLYVTEHRRNQGLASRWLHELASRFPEKDFWLTIDEEGLIQFYKKSNYQLIEEIDLGSHKEWLLTYEAKDK